MSDVLTQSDPPGRWRALLLLALAELLAMALWFSASASAPQIAEELHLSGAQQSWLTMSVQLGFVAGALLSALLNLPDRAKAHRLFAISTLAGALLNMLITMDGVSLAIIVVLRFATGMALAGVYPTGMKLMATWFRRGRGLAIGALVGALTVGSATPHLLHAISINRGDLADVSWRGSLLASSALAGAGALIAALLVRAGPLLPTASSFSWRVAGRLLSSRSQRRANFGYLGHMWELYAMWTWAPIMLLASYDAAGWRLSRARLAGFAIVALGGVSSIVAGAFADRIGRTTITIASLVVSGSCALVAGFLFDNPAMMTIVCLIWGTAVVADSAQFSAAVSELCDASYVGTALTMQTCAGFALTIVSIRLVPMIEQGAGWGWAMAALAIGPVFGVWHMARLRRSPEAVKMASGNR